MWIGNNFIINDDGTMYYGSTQLTVPKTVDGNNRTIAPMLDVDRQVLSDALSYLATNAPEWMNNQLAAAKQHGINQENARISQALVTHREGCVEGKRKFAEHADLTMPTQTMQFSIMVEVPYGSDYTDVESDIAACVHEYRDVDVIEDVLGVNHDFTEGEDGY